MGFRDRPRHGRRGRSLHGRIYGVPENPICLSRCKPRFLTAGVLHAQAYRGTTMLDDLKKDATVRMQNACRCSWLT